MQLATRLGKNRTELLPQAADQGQLRVLVVDDSRAQRVLIGSLLRRAGFHVEEADSGKTALAVFENTRIDLVLSDWVMPEMNGPELCAQLRARGGEYTYFILLTSKNARAEIAEGLERGADDFLTKPVDGDELRARIAAGARIVQMQQELTRKNALISETLSELTALYDVVDRDLVEASKLQKSLMRDQSHEFSSGTVSLLLRSSNLVGGDLAGYFHASPTQIGIYSIDVSGHGITSALMTARLAGHLSVSAPEHNIALSHTAGDFYRVLPPKEVTSRLNRLMTSMMETDQYFTMVIGVIDLTTGRVRMTQAGHPHPLVQRKDGTCEFFGNGGLPVGLIEDATYDQFEFRLNPGDRLFVGSDGFTECLDPAGEMLDEEGLVHLLTANRSIGGRQLLDKIVSDLAEFQGSDQFPDDVSAVLFEFRGSTA